MRKPKQPEQMQPPQQRKPNDLSHCLTALDSDHTPIAVVELSLSSWLVAGVVPGVVMIEGGETDVLERWFSDGGDVRNDPVITAEILEFIQLHGVRSVVMADRIMGCPHKEGIDYPEGAKCPSCPFWAGRDRFTGKIIH